MPEYDQIEVVGVLNVVHDADKAVRCVVPSTGHVPQVDGRVVGDPGHPLRGRHPADTAAWFLIAVGIEDKVVSGSIHGGHEAIVGLIPGYCGQ